MKIFKIEELAKIQMDQAYKYAGLFDQQGTAIIPFNPNKVPIERRLQEIETKLLSPGLKDGYYIVRCKTTTAKNVIPDSYTVYKGENLSESAPVPQQVQIVEKHISPDVLTYDQALKMQVELEKLKLENLQLQKENERLLSELSEVETLSEEAQNSVWSNAKDFLTELVTMGAPLLDKHFELKEKALTLEAMKINNLLGSTNKRPANPVTKPDDQRKIENYILSKKQDPETYEQLAAMYNGAANVEAFLKSLNEYNNLMYNELTGTDEN